MSSPITSTAIYTAGVILPALALSTVCLRYYAKTLRLQTFGVDDVFIGIAMVICVGLASMEVWGSSKRYLAGEYHMSDNSNPLAPLLLALGYLAKISLANYLLQDLALGLVKLSVLLFYRRIFCGRTFDICSKLLIALVSLWSLVFIFIHLFQCGTHFHAIWGTLDERLKVCLDVTPITEAMAVTDVVTDGFILALPVPMVLRLQMSRPRKVSIICIFLLGGLAVAAGIIRLLGSRFSLTTEKAPQPTADLQDPQARMRMMEAMVRQMSYGMSTMTALIFWTVVELSLSITAACLPTLRPIVASNGRIGGWVDEVRSRVVGSWGSEGWRGSGRSKGGYGKGSGGEGRSGGKGIVSETGGSIGKKSEAKECYVRVESRSQSRASDFDTKPLIVGNTGGGGPWGPSQTRSYARRISDGEAREHQMEEPHTAQPNVVDATSTTTQTTPTIPVLLSPAARSTEDPGVATSIGRRTDLDIEMRTYGKGGVSGTHS